MRYAIHDGQHLYEPQDHMEALLVFHVLHQKLELMAPYCVARDYELCNEQRDGPWWHWSFYLPWTRPSSDADAFVLVLDVALPHTFLEGEDLPTRWTTAKVDSLMDAKDLLALLRQRVDRDIKTLREDRLIHYLRLLRRSQKFQ